MEKKGGKRRYDNDPVVKLSKKLSYILRHGAEKEGIKMGSDGYVLVDDLLSRADFKHITFDKIKHVVENNDKKRYQLEQKEVDGKQVWVIRANQGHSIATVNDEQLLNKISLDIAKSFGIVVHGTYKAFWEPISKEGLKTMTRNHIHFAIGYPGSEEVISGMRKSCDIYIEIDIVKAIEDGVEFYLSNNNVILTPGVNKVLLPKYFKVVKDKAGKTVFEQIKEKDPNVEEKKQDN